VGSLVLGVIDYYCKIFNHFTKLNIASDFIDTHLTENPFLCLNMGPVTVTGSADMFNLTVMGAYTTSDGVSLRPTLEDYSLVYFLGGEAFAVQDLIFVMDTSPFEQ